MRLYSYWRSSTAYRVRIALHLKGLAFETVPVDLGEGAQHEAAYRALNPSAAVPTLELPDGTRLTQSMAILDWLDATHPPPLLLPSDPMQAAHVRAAALVIATDIHPVNNLRILAALRERGVTDTVAWMNKWMTEGLTAFQSLLPSETPFCFGDTPSLADICLIPQLYNAHRWGCDLAPFSRLTQIEQTCLALPAFAAALPEAQPDAIKG